MNILVIGGLSKVGFALTCNLSMDHSVTVIDNCNSIECIKEFQEKIPSNVIYYKFDINDDKNFSMFTNILKDNDLIYLLIEEYNQDLLEYIQENHLNIKFKTDLNFEQIINEYEKNKSKL